MTPENPTEWIEWLRSNPTERAIVVPWSTGDGENVLAVDGDEDVVALPGRQQHYHKVSNPNSRISWLDRNGDAEKAKLSDTRLSGIHK